MPALSLVFESFRKAQGQKHNPGVFGARKDNSSPATPRSVRGSTASLGSRTFKGRDSEAGAKKEFEKMNSPIFRAYMERLSPKTPISDRYGKGGRGY